VSARKEDYGGVWFNLFDFVTSIEAALLSFCKFFLKKKRLVLGNS